MFDNVIEKRPVLVTQVIIVVWNILFSTTTDAAGSGHQHQGTPNDLIKCFESAVELTVKVSEKGNNVLVVIQFQVELELDYQYLPNPYQNG